MRLPLLALALTALPYAAWGWGKAGHEVVATIAQMHLHPTVMPTLCHILGLDAPGAPPCRLASIAAWADAVRFYKRWSGPLHYVGAVGDYPSETCLFPGTQGWEGQLNVLTGIRNVTDILEGGPGVVEDELAEEALKFLVHFLGDLHMPLHLTGRARGGNSIKVLWNGRHTNLHSVWDGLLLAKSLRTLPANYTLPLPIPQIEDMLTGTIYDPFIRRIMWEGVLGTWADDLDAWLACPASFSLPGEGQHVMGALGVGGDTDDDIVCPYAWSAPIHALNCDIVWPPAIDQPPYNTSHGSLLQLDTPEYADEILKRRILEKLMAQGGIRLAGILNYLFAQEDEVKGGCGCTAERGGYRLFWIFVILSYFYID
ncbi:phospholipase C/P1 nuclease domain-containing protein [Infundibulicybe gibba]|nr:phospholipase C/P1 nuclease domain-containing protein [Infundibulicybe gibba]